MQQTQPEQCAYRIVYNKASVQAAAATVRSVVRHPPARPACAWMHADPAARTRHPGARALLSHLDKADPAIPVPAWSSRCNCALEEWACTATKTAAPKWTWLHAVENSSATLAAGQGEGRRCQQQWIRLARTAGAQEAGQGEPPGHTWIFQQRASSKLTAIAAPGGLQTSSAVLSNSRECSNKTPSSNSQWPSRGGQGHHQLTTAARRPRSRRVAVARQRSRPS